MTQAEELAKLKQVAEALAIENRQLRLQLAASQHVATELYRQQFKGNGAGFGSLCNPRRFRASFVIPPNLKDN